MAILQPVRKRLSTVGIVFYQKCPLNLRNSLTSFLFALGSFSNCAHLLYEAKTFNEFADSVSAATAVVSAVILFGIIIWKTLPLYDCLNNLEASVAKRE